MSDDVLLDCKESGHWWPTTRAHGGFWQEGELRSGQRVLVRKQICLRCGLRGRTHKISAQTGERMTKVSYFWVDNQKRGALGFTSLEIRLKQVRA